ncbi:hypothetical protein ACWC09_28080 [Streptomyces sp. NPDC001617]
MRTSDYVSAELGGTYGSAGQLQAEATLAAAGLDGQSGAVWDQPLPWAAPLNAHEPQYTGEPESAGQPTSSQTEPAAAPEAGDEATDHPEAAARPAEAAPDESEAEVWQAAVAEKKRGAHAAPAALGVGAVAGHAVSKWLLGAAVAAGGLLAAVGASEGLGSHPSSASAKEQPEPIPGPGKDLDTAGTPTAAPSAPVKEHPAPRAGKATVAALPLAALPLAAPHGGKAASDGATTLDGHAPTPAHTSQAQVSQQSEYLSVQTSVQSPNSYWSQNSVSVTTTKQLTALKVVVHIAQTGGVANTGVWTSLGDKVTVHSARASDGGADYVVILNAGITIDPGTYVFQFQYNHDQGTRNTIHDLYAVGATAPGSDGSENRQGRF